MVNEDDTLPVKKPIPLPRKSLLKQNKVGPFKEEDRECDENVSCLRKSEKKNFVRDDWKSTSGSFVLEKGRQVKNEVQKLEKSVKSIIARRKSVQTKCASASKTLEHSRSDSLPDDSALLNISFNSPLSDEDKFSDSQSTSVSEDNSFYENELSPPPYPPPDLPDESVYDTMKSFQISDAHSLKSTSSESTCNCDELSASLLKEKFLKYNGPVREEDSEKNLPFSDSGNRYEVIVDNVSDSLEYDNFKSFKNIPKTELLSPNVAKDVNAPYEESCGEFSNIKYIIHLFDPLQGKESVGNQARDNFSVSSKSIDDSPSSYESVHNNLLINIKKENSFQSEISSDSVKHMYSDISEGHYGKIRKIKSFDNDYIKVTLTNDIKPSEPPPIPPRKVHVSSTDFQNESRNTIFDKKGLEKYENILVEEKIKTSDILQWSSLKRVAKKVADNIESRASYISLPGKKSAKAEDNEDKLNQKIISGDAGQLPQSFPKHSGVLFKGGVQRWGVLSQRKLTLFANKDSPDVKETLPMNGVLSVNVILNKMSLENSGIYCFEISISSKKEPLLFGVPSVSERHIWMRKLLESISPSFPAKLSMDYTKAGWCYAKESISCPWNKFCILLHHRTLYLSSELGALITADLRKARSTTLQVDGFLCERVTEKGPLVLIDLQDKTLYLQMDYERETKSWETVITEAALKNGPTLCEQQLTKDNVPTIVDKCLNFVHTHGTFSEGIYRRNGSNRTISHLLASFRCNAWSVQLTKDDCSEFDVSSVLKRYFRDLPEPLLVTEIHEELGSILEVTDKEKKIEKYKLALKKLPDINYLTARRLMGHLYFINLQRDKNLMGADNLAAVWGPTLLQVQEQVSLNSNCFKTEALVINDLITFYPEVFEVENAEVEREKKILEMLEIYQKNSSTLNKKPSGELKVWVYLNSLKNVDECINVSINPQKTAEEVCKELSSKATDSIHLLCLEEVVCNGHLTRPLNHSEKILDTVLRWSYWDEADRKDNCLVLAKNDLFRQVALGAKYPILICEELKFADQKSKSFKSYQFEFSQAKLSCYKDKSCLQKLAEWKIEDIVWYFGHEPKRNPHARWAITFIEKQLIGPRTKERPYFGNTICGNSEEQKFKLISAMLMAQYANGILPTPNFME